MLDAASNPPTAHHLPAELSTDNSPRRAPWWELTLQLPAGLAEDAGALLVDLGAMGAETMAAATFHQRAWRSHASMGPRDEAAQTGPLPAESATAAAFVIASFAAQDAGVAANEAASWPDADSILAAAREALTGLVGEAALASLACEKRNDSAWADAWRDHFKPLKIGRTLWIVPSWERHFAAPIGSCVLTIDPGMAFGTGQHATTALCLKAIERVADARAAQTPRAPWRMLDVGAGTGILALAGLELGAAHAVLVDIDDEALAACRHNLAAAGLGGRASVQRELPAASETYALVVANILAAPLTDMMPELVTRTAVRGTLLLSGILTDQVAGIVRAVDRAAKRAGRTLPKVAHLQHEAWVALAFGHLV